MASEYHIGLDLGQSRDYTAICVLAPDEGYQMAYRRREELYDRLESTRRHPHTDEQDIRHMEREIERRMEHEPEFSIPAPVYHVRHLERMQLGTSYVDVARRVRSIIHSPQLIGLATLTVDATGVGAAVTDLLAAEGLDFDSVTITSGDKPSRDGNAFRVPKRDLVARAQVALQNRRLKIAPRLPEAQTLVSELQSFRYKITAAANVTYESWRESEHDDLVLALTLALWSAERGSSAVDESLAGTTGPYTLEGYEPYALDSRDLYRMDNPL